MLCIISFMLCLIHNSYYIDLRFVEKWFSLRLFFFSSAANLKKIRLHFKS